MNKQELEAENRRLTDENEALRELLAAVSLAADTVPVAKGADWIPEWKRSTRVLANIKFLSRLDGGWPGEIAHAARELRSIAAEPVGYEVFKDDAEATAALSAPADAGTPVVVDEDELPAVIVPCGCSHGGHLHDAAGCMLKSCGCAKFRPGAAVVAPEPPAVVAGAVEPDLAALAEVGVKPCQLPEAHGWENLPAHGYFCNTAAHHLPASVSA